MESLGDERRSVTSTLAVGVNRENVEVMIRGPGGAVGYLQVAKIPPGHPDAGIPSAARSVTFGDGITLLLWFADG